MCLVKEKGHQCRVGYMCSVRKGLSIHSDLHVLCEERVINAEWAIGVVQGKGRQFWVDYMCSVWKGSSMQSGLHVFYDAVDHSRIC